MNRVRLHQHYKKAYRLSFRHIEECPSFYFHAFGTFDKTAFGNQNAKIMILQQQDKPIDMAERKLPYLSASETNYLAFGLLTKDIITNYMNT